MFFYVVKRLILTIPTFLGITVITFCLLQLSPADPASLAAQEAVGQVTAAGDTALIVAETKRLYGLDQPLHRQYLRWLRRLLVGDFGISYRDHRPVTEKIYETLPITLGLNGASLVLMYLIAFPLGAAIASKPRGWLDRLSNAGLLSLYSLPSFWLALILIVAFAGGDHLNWFPIGDIMSDGALALAWHDRVGNILWHAVLPVVCLTVGALAFLTRFTRASFVEVLRQDYIRTARAKGVGRWAILTRHAGRNALIPLIALMSLMLPQLISGSVIIEQVFSLPGIGRLGFEAVLSRDYPVVMAIVSIGALLTLISMIAADVVLAAVDPRVTFERREVP